MKTHHRSPTPARELSTSLRVKFISESTSSTAHFESIEEALATSLVYKYTDLSVKKYRMIINNQNWKYRLHSLKL